MDFCTTYNIKPLSDADIQNYKLKILENDKLFKIMMEFKCKVNLILTCIRKQTKSCDEEELAQIESIQGMLNIVPEDEIFLRSKDKLWAVRKQIVDRNYEWFTNMSFNSMLLEDENKATLESIIELVKYKFAILTKAEQNIYWEYLANLINLICKFKLEIKEYK